METQTRKGTLSDAIDAVTTAEIIEEFEVPHKTRRGKTYLLCPGHEDRHYGSCYVDKEDDGYYCYVCGKHVNKWNMVLQLNGNRKADAYEWFFRMAGLLPSETNHDDPLRQAKRLIKKVAEHIHNNVVYNDIYTCEKVNSSYGRNAKGEYMYSEVAIANPLLELYKTDKELFQKVILQQLDSEAARIAAKKQFYEKHRDECLYVENVELIPNDELAAVCDEMITDLHLLMAEVQKL